MKKSVLGFIILAMSLLTLGFFFSLSDSPSVSQNFIFPSPFHSKPMTEENHLSNIKTNDSHSDVTITEWIKNETSKIGQPDEAPEETEKILLLKSENLTENEILTLKNMALNFNLSPDERFLSTYLLSRNRNAINELSEIILSDFPKPINPQVTQFEESLRGLAIEGLASSKDKNIAIQTLKHVLQKVDNTFLQDRIQRSLTFLTGKALPAEIQDKKALEKLLDHR